MTRLLPCLLLLSLIACTEAPEPALVEDATPDADPTPVDMTEDVPEEDAALDLHVDLVDDGLFALPERPWPITETGPYTVGYRTDELTYRAQPFGKQRTLRLAIWYPSRSAPQGRYARYLGLLTRRGNDGTAPVYEGIPVAPDGPYPVLIFSHGNSGVAEQNYFMTEFFTSHGFVVISPDHTENTFRDTQGAINFASALDRPQDMSAVLDWAYALPEGDPLHGALSQDVVMSGHSFGGLTTLANVGATIPVEDLYQEACVDSMGGLDETLCRLFGDDDVQAMVKEGFLDERIKVALPQTPASGALFREGTGEIAIPTLMFTGALDRSTPNVADGDPLFAAMAPGPHRRADFKTGGHFTFSNMCSLIGNLEIAANDGCGAGFIAPERAYLIINHYAMAFVRRHLFGDTSHDALLDGQETPYAADVDYTRK